MGDREARARRVIDGTAYLTLATADAAGVPWASPVWFAHVGHTDFVWVSKVERRHSVNIGVRPQVGFVIYDSTQAPGTGEAVYGAGRAALTVDPAHLAAFNTRCREQGLTEWGSERLSGRAALRMFHVVADTLWVLDDAEDRVVVDL